MTDCCLFCGSNKTVKTNESVKYNTVTYHYYRCLECGSEYVDPMVPPEEDYYNYGQPEVRWEYKLAGDIIKNSTGNNGPLIDIGCNEGQFLSYISDLSIDAIGVDFNEDKIITARGKGLNCLNVNFADFNAKNKFSTATFFHVIEHVENPHEFLFKLKHILHEDATLLCSIPNTERFELRFRRDEADYAPNHLSRITHKGLVKLFENMGYKFINRYEENNDVSFLRGLSLYANKILDMLKMKDIVAKHRLSNYAIKFFLFILSIPYVSLVMIIQQKKAGYTSLYVFKNANN